MRLFRRFFAVSPRAALHPANPGEALAAADSSRHFEDLKNRINARLVELHAAYAQEQIHQYEWLYGALGMVPAPVMLICENPSLAGIRSAEVDTPGGGPPDIESQWWGGRRNNAAKRFRAVLFELGLKTTPPAARGGWRCYITNAVKEANIASDQSSLKWSARLRQARDWGDVLSWEYSQVRPDHVFCVGRSASAFVEMLQKENRLPRFFSTCISHYSKRGRDDEIRCEMRDAIHSVIGHNR